MIKLCPIIETMLNSFNIIRYIIGQEKRQERYAFLPLYINIGFDSNTQGRHIIKLEQVNSSHRRVCLW